VHPILFKLGPLTVHSYGLLVMIGFAAAVWWTIREAKRRDISRDQVLDITLAVFFGGLIGARGLFILLTPGLLSHPDEWFRVWEGGLSFHGSILGGAIAMAWATRRTGIPLVPMMDASAPGVALGYAFGRIGCFLNGCCYGGACDLPWATRFVDPSLPGGWTPPSHPAQLYSSAAGLLMFGILAWMSPRQRYKGQLVLSFVVLYSIYRFMVEFVRKGVTAQIAFGGLTVTQVASIFIVLAAAYLMTLASSADRRRKRIAVGAESGP
jgi:phosphatidylglycerol:prolipoprotein diacylglycerol transferase